MHWLMRFAMFVIAAAVSTTAAAQTYTTDARRIGLGGAGGTENIATALVDSPRPYGRIVLPFGLIQLLSSLDQFDPESADYNPIRAMEYTANPLHYTFGRGRETGRLDLIADLVRARVSYDLHDYEGTPLATDLLAEGLGFPLYGRTLTIASGRFGYHGVFLGGGPYLATRTSAGVDPALASMLSTSAGASVSAGRFGLASDAVNQLALAGTIGYRARLPLSGAGAATGRSGLYFAGNFHYLHGLWLDDFRVRFRMDTDETGRLLEPAGGAAATIERITSERGRGLAVDLGAAAVIGRWQVGVGANGIGNHIDWRGRERETLTRGSVTDGGSGYAQLIEDLPGTDRRRQPVDVVVDAGFHGDRWTALAEYGRGFLGRRFHTGIERRLGVLELRAGARLTRGDWHPAAGVGVNMTPSVGLDVALFSVSTSLDRHRQLAIAASIRFAGIR